MGRPLTVSWFVMVTPVHQIQSLRRTEVRPVTSISARLVSRTVGPTLAIASRSLEYNFGPGWEDEFFKVYGIERDEERISFYRLLWDNEDRMRH